MEDEGEAIRLNINKTYNEMGSGLGIYICKSILKKLGHKLQITSKEGIGTQVYIHIGEVKLNINPKISMENLTKSTIKNIEFPLYFESPMKSFDNSNKESSFISTVKSQPILLIVEDNLNLRLAAQRILEFYFKSSPSPEFNFTVAACDDGVDLLYKVKNDHQSGENQIKIIVTDENMNYMCGSEAVGLVREWNKVNKIGKIFFASLTAFTDEQIIHQIHFKGVNLIIEKSLNKEKVSLLMEDYKQFYECG